MLYNFKIYTSNLIYSSTDRYAVLMVQHSLTKTILDES